jgi:hypothetical protein
MGRSALGVIDISKVKDDGKSCVVLTPKTETGLESRIVLPVTELGAFVRIIHSVASEGEDAAT